jgi:hypothetical protein
MTRQGNPVSVRRQSLNEPPSGRASQDARLVRGGSADYAPRAVIRPFVVLIATLALGLSFVVTWPAGAQEAPGLVHLVDGDVPSGPPSVDTPSGERIGRLALANHVRNLSPPLALDPALDAAARDQLRAAVDQAGVLGRPGPSDRLVRVAPDTLVRLGVVSSADADGRANLFSLAGPAQADAVGSAGGVVTLGDSGRTLLVAAVAWRDASLTGLDDLTAIFGAAPQSPAELDEAAARRWLDQENRARQQAGFPNELLARRNPVLDREAENILLGRRGEPLLPRLTEPPAGFEAPGPLHANNRTCQPNCDPLWAAPDRLVDAYSQTSVEDRLTSGPDQPYLLNFDVYTQQQRWLGRYWDSYRLFGVAAHVRTDNEIVDHRPLARAAVESLAPGAADQWDVREYPVDYVIVGSDPWPRS